LGLGFRRGSHIWHRNIPSEVAGAARRFRTGSEGWQVKESFEKADIHPQVFAEVIKPYVGIERVIREKQFMERE